MKVQPEIPQQGSIDAGNKIVVLLIDDQAIVNETVRRLFINERDIELHWISSAHEAVEKIDEIEPTVILQDLILPDINGLSLLRKLRKKKTTENIPIIILSAKNRALFKKDAFSMGADDYLVKIPEQIELIARIRYHAKSYLAFKQMELQIKNLRLSNEKLKMANYQESVEEKNPLHVNFLRNDQSVLRDAIPEYPSEVFNPVFKRDTLSGIG